MLVSCRRSTVEERWAEENLPKVMDMVEFHLLISATNDVTVSAKFQRRSPTSRCGLSQGVTSGRMTTPITNEITRKEKRRERRRENMERKKRGMDKRSEESKMLLEER